MKKIAKRIALHRETLQRLAASSLEEAAGGLSHMPCPTLAPSCFQTSCAHYTNCLCH
jgi:hypothetical protein